jgi:hypothetical protein
VRKAPVGASIGRGVWVAPWQGPNGETILVAVSRKRRKIAERLLSPGDDHVGAGEALWDMIERDDPEPMLKVI